MKRHESRDMYHPKKVDIEQIMSEVLDVTKPDEEEYRSELLRDRLELVLLATKVDQFEILKENNGIDSLSSLVPCKSLTWQEDAAACL